MSLRTQTREHCRRWFLLLLAACLFSVFTVTAFHDHELSREASLQAPCVVCEIASTLAVAVFAIGLVLLFHSVRRESTPETHSYQAIQQPWAYIRPPPARG